MSSRHVLLVVLPALAGVAALAPSASAATVAVLPAAGDARTFGTTNGGWTSSVDYGTLNCTPGVSCPVATPSYRSTGGTGGAADGHLRDTFGTLLGVLSTTTITWTSPSFTAPGGADTADLSVNVRPQIASLRAIGTVSMTPRIVDVDDPAASIELGPRQLTAASASFSPQDFAVPAAQLVPGRTYRIAIGVSTTTNVSAVTSGNVDLDDVALTLEALAGPRDLTGTVPATGPVRVAGTVDAHGFDTDVTVEYGPTASYGATTAAVRLPGATPGAQEFSVPLTGLTPGTTYHYRVRAASADGVATTADATFVAPTPPTTAAPTVTGAGNSRVRTVTFARAADVTAAAVELVDDQGGVQQSWPDTDGDGSESITLPAADGSYALRVRRTTDRGLESTSTVVPATLDRTGPDVSGLGLAVTPAASPDRSRALTFTRPADAASVSAQVLDADGATVGAASTVAGGSASVLLGATDGIYRVRLTLADALGNTSVVTSPALTLDTQAPQAGPAPTVTGAGNARERTVVFTRDASATDVAVEVLDVHGDVVDTVSVPTGERAEVVLPDADGRYAVRVRQTDAAGNDARSTATAVELDRVAPEAGPAPSVPDGTDGSEPITVSFVRAPDAVEVSVEVRDQHDVVVLRTPVPTGSTATVRLPAVAGRYGIRVVQIDAAGNRTVSAETTVERRAAITEVPATTAAAPAATPVSPAACPRPATAVTTVVRAGSRVSVRGFSTSPAGTSVIVVDGANRRAGTAIVGADGAFAALVAPTPDLRRGEVRYRVVDRGRSSSAVQLHRANALTSVRRTGGSVTLSGRVDLARTGRARSIVALGGAGACPDPAGMLTPVGRARIDAQGRYRLTVRADAAGRLLVRTRVVGARAAARSAYVVR